MESLSKAEYPTPITILPHRPPMLLIDKIVDYRPGVSLIASKLVREDEPFFRRPLSGAPNPSGGDYGGDDVSGVRLVRQDGQPCEGQIRARDQNNGCLVSSGGFSQYGAHHLHFLQAQTDELFGIRCRSTISRRTSR